MSASAPDFYHQKTDAELLFFVEHPDYYQPDLVEAARRELRRRGVAPAPPPPLVPMLPEAPPEGLAGLRLGPLVLAVVAVLAVGLGVLYFVQQKNRPAGPALAAPVPKAPPQLTEVATSTIPNYDGLVAQTVKAQLERVPAAERATAAATREGQPLRQYRELSKRFWAAETQTEYVLSQARKGEFTAALPGHVESALTTWQQWNKANAYSYKFGSAMSTHFGVMYRVAQQQQEGLQDLLLVARNPQQYENDKTRQRAADVSDLLSSLLPRSPVTGERYNPIVRRVHL